MDRTYRDLSCFYSNHEIEKRHEGWNILRHLKLQNPKMWLCIGHFNEILFHSEKYGGARRDEKQMEAFRRVLKDCILSDLGSSKGKYSRSS